MNRLKTAALLALLTALVLFVGMAIGGRQGLVIAFVFAGVMNFVSYWWSDKIVLRMHGAREVTEADAPELFGIVRRLTGEAGIPMPRVYVMSDQAPNAFATGRNPEHAAVAVTAGLLELLNRDEITAVLAHELGHVRNRDTLIMTVTGAIAGALSMLADMALWGMLLGRGSDDEGNPLGGLLGIIVAPFAAMMIQMSISRSREFLADEQGARLSRNPMALATALRKLEGWKQRLPMVHGTPATAHLYIVNPFVGRSMARLFSTHPSTGERVARLEQMAMSGDYLVR
ncbi:MAG: zinc metalloprotease HtpX [Thermoanaerobaculia bacterium]